MLDFAMKVSQSAHLVGDADIAAFFGLSNRLANVTSMRPNPEFYDMGRG